MLEIEYQTRDMRSLYKLERNEKVHELIDLLNESDNPAVRARAAEILVNLGDLDGLDAVIDALHNDKDDRVKTTIADALSSKGDLDFIKKAMKKSMGFNSSKANWALLKNFKEALNNENPGIRVNAAYALGEIKKPKEVLKPLIKALNDSNSRVRTQAAASLGKIKHPKALKPLNELLNDENHEVRREAVSAIHQLNHRDTKKHVLKAMNDKNEHVREEAAMALADYKGKKVIQTLIEGLKDESSAVKEASAFSLMEVISNVPADKSHETREKVAKELEEIETGFDYSPILLAVTSGVKSSVKKNAIWLIGEIGDEEAIPPLVNLLDHENPQIRRLSATSLSKISDEAPPELIKALESEKTNKKRMAAFALGEIGDESVLKEIESLIDSSEQEVRKMALKTYGKLGGEL